jgi:hypothetical protein
MGNPSRSQSSDWRESTPKAPVIVVDWSPILEKPMSPATAFPKECDNEVGGVLIMLLEPAVVDANVEEIEDDEDDVEGDIKLGGRAVMAL